MVLLLDVKINRYLCMKIDMIMNDFEKRIENDLIAHLHSKGTIDALMPECPDVEGKWESIAQSYLPDGVREFNAYPLASLGWMMYIGMAIAKYWDEDWSRYACVDDLYGYMLGKTHFDHLDEYILQQVLGLEGNALVAAESITGDCAARVDSALRHSGLQPGTAEAFRAYVACLHQLYRMGMAVQLHSMGYRMAKIR